MNRPRDEEFFARIDAHEAKAAEAQQERDVQLGHISDAINAIAKAQVDQYLFEKYPGLAEAEGFSTQANNEKISAARLAINISIEDAIQAKYRALRHDHTAHQLRTALGITEPPAE